MGEPTKVLFETYHDGIAHGHTANFLEASVASPVPLDGETREVKLTGTDGAVCYGDLL